jgi:hypothetical protein
VKFSLSKSYFFCLSAERPIIVLNIKPQTGSSISKLVQADRAPQVHQPHQPPEPQNILIEIETVKPD